MLQISSRLRPHVTSKIVRAGAARRLQSTHSGGGGGGGKILIGAAGCTSLVAGVVGYSAWSDDNRKSVESSIPGSKYVLSAVLGPLQEAAPAPPKSVKPDVGLVRKRLEEEKKKKKKIEKEEEKDAAAPPAVADNEPFTSSPEVFGGHEVLPITEKTEQEPSEVEPVSEDQTSGSGETVTEPPPAAEASEGSAVSELESRMAAGELSQDVENAALSQTLDDLATLAQKEITGALAAAEDAATAIRQHAERAYHAIDAGQDKEQLFSMVAEVSRLRAEAVKGAEDKIAAAGNTIEKLGEQIQAGLSSSLTKANESLINAEERLADLKYALENIKNLVAESERDSKVVADYRELVEAGREQFESEVRSLLPEVKLGETSDKLTTDELNLLIAHAHRKVLQLQKQLARHQASVETMEHDRFKEALVKQREDDSKLLEAKIGAELERQQQQSEIEYKRKMAQLREELEGELRAQLKRQAAAHSDHLADVLHVQEQDLESKWSNRLQEGMEAEKDKYLRSLARVMGQLEGIKSALSDRADADKAAYAARELWLACESLRNALRYGRDNAKSWEEQLTPLGDHMHAIKAASGGGNPYVAAVVGAVGEDAQVRGVYTEEALRERFIKVERICKRVSMIGDNGGSLIKYFLSYLQSFLVLNAFEYLPGTEVRDEEVAVDSLSTYDILARARYCLEKDDLTQSVRYMNLLRGEPRNVASSWLKEARLTLETRQAADALLAHAAATAVQAL